MTDHKGPTGGAGNVPPDPSPPVAPSFPPVAPSSFRYLALAGQIRGGVVTTYQPRRR
jgi:hypothetical protein